MKFTLKMQRPERNPPQTDKTYPKRVLKDWSTIRSSDADISTNGKYVPFEGTFPGVGWDL
jgi:hypothetical protein